MVKYYEVSAGQVILSTANPAFPDLIVKDTNQFTVFGVVEAIVGGMSGSEGYDARCKATQERAAERLRDHDRLAIVKRRAGRTLGAAKLQVFSITDF
jgi:hypothetical protein